MTLIESGKDFLLLKVSNQNLCGFLKKVIVSLTIDVRLPLIVPWHLSQKTSWLCLQFANKLWRQKYHIHKCCHYLSQKRPITLGLSIAFPSVHYRFLLKIWSYLLLHLNPVSYMMYSKCSWSLCQRIDLLILALSLYIGIPDWPGEVLDSF